MIIMRCENLFCIYEREGECLLDVIDLDMQGGCNECVYVDIDKDYLEKIKKQKRIELGEGID